MAPLAHGDLWLNGVDSQWFVVVFARNDGPVVAGHNSSSGTSRFGGHGDVETQLETCVDVFPPASSSEEAKIDAGHSDHF